MEITHWDDKFFYSTHEFFKLDKKVAEGTSKSLVINKGEGRLTPASVVEHINAYQAN